MWSEHEKSWRDPGEVLVQSQWRADPEPAALEYRVRGGFWDVLESLGQTLIVTREYEHLVLGLTVRQGRPRVSHVRLPHPSGVAFDPTAEILFIASTRNPNVLYEFAPGRCAFGEPRRQEQPGALMPIRARVLPGRLYLHDLALVGGRLMGNAVSMNAVAELPEQGGFRPVWWPACIDGPKGPRWERNYLQLNSIAAGARLENSFFSASIAAPSARRPGHRNFPVDGRGVVFSGRTREVIATGLTRPHSARLAGGQIWIANSGYGEFGRIDSGRFEPVARFRGWTRGVCCLGRIAFVGSSRVLPRFRHYAPGVDAARTETGVHAVEIASGRILGSLLWPSGDQIFAIESCGAAATPGFPSEGRRSRALVRRLYFEAVPPPPVKRSR